MSATAPALHGCKSGHASCAFLSAGELVVVINCFRRAPLRRILDGRTGVRSRWRSHRPLSEPAASRRPGAEILLQQISEDKRRKNRVHLDSRMRELEPETHGLIGLGAQVLTVEP